MPLRYITRIEDDLSIHVPQAILDLRFKGEQYECEVTRWWSKDRKKELAINEGTTLQRWDYKILLNDNPVCKKYGFVRGDYLEIVFEKLKYKSQQKDLLRREKWEVSVLFPARRVDELMFDPDARQKEN